jgi:hypothetical protein
MWHHINNLLINNTLYTYFRKSPVTKLYYGKGEVLFRTFCIMMAILVSIPGFAGADTSGGSKVILEGFEYLNQGDLTKQFASRVWAVSAEYEITFERGLSRSGESSMGLVYKPSSGSGYVKIQKEFPASLNWNDFKGISVYIYGDSSNNEISVKFKNGYGDIWRSRWVRVDWSGWRPASFEFSEFKLDLFDSDGGPGNRSIMLGEIKAFAVAERGAGNSKIFLDEISLVSDKEIKGIRLAGENEPPANCILWGIEAPHGKAIEYAAPKDWSEASGISFRVKGDMSGSEFAVMVTDRDNECYRTPWIKLAWNGWKSFYYDFDLFLRESCGNAVNGDAVFGQKGVKALSVIVRGNKPYAISLDNMALSCSREIRHSGVEGLKGFNSNGKVYLYWAPSENPFLAHYNIRRNGSMAGSTNGQFYSENAPSEEAAYNYGVTAVYSDGHESGSSEVKVAVSPAPRISRGEEVAVNGNWIYVGGNKFFVKGAVCDPHKLMEADMARLKQAGFNTIVAAVPLSERDLIVAEKNGLMVIQALGVPGDTDFGSVESLRYHAARVREITEWSRRHSNILYYLVSSGIEPGAVLSSGPAAAGDFLKELAHEARIMDPDREASVAYGESCDYPQLPVFGIASVVFKAPAPEGPMPGDYAKWYKTAHANDRPLVITDAGGGQGVGKLDGMIAAGATGVCTAERGGALSRVLTDFWPHYSKVSRSGLYEGSSALEITSDKPAYTAGQKPRISFTLKRAGNMPVSNAVIEYSIRDTGNGISSSAVAGTNTWGSYKSSFTLPYNTDDTVLSVFAVAVTADGKRIPGLKHIGVSENKSLKEKFKAEVKVYERPPYEIRRSAAVIKIDGYPEECWAAAPGITIDNSRTGKPALRSGSCAGDRDLSGSVKLLWDKDNLYLFADIKDDMPMVNSRSRHNIRNGDAVEIFLGSDPDNLPKEGYSPKDFQVALGSNEKMWIFGQADGGARNAVPSGSEIAARKTGAGYAIEARLALDNLGYDDFSEGKELALDVALDDADGTGSRECQMTWNGAEDNDRNSRYWGRAVLKGGL